MCDCDKYKIIKAENGILIEDELNNFDLSELDWLEERMYNDFIKHSTKSESLQIIINSVEGDYSQLSPKLAEIAEKQDCEEEFKNGGGVGEKFEGVLNKIKPILSKKKITIGDLLSEHEFISGNKYWRIPYAIIDGDKFKVGDSVLWLDSDDDDREYKGVIDWMMVGDYGNVEVALKDEKEKRGSKWFKSGIGRLNIEDIKHLPKGYSNGGDVDEWKYISEYRSYYTIKDGVLLQSPSVETSEDESVEVSESAFDELELKKFKDLLKQKTGWEYGKDYNIDLVPTKHKKGGGVGSKNKYKLGDKYRSDFDYDGMLEMGLKANISWGYNKLVKLHDSFEDVNYATASKPLWEAIQNLKNGKNELAEKNIIEFHKKVKEETMFNPDITDMEMENGGTIDSNRRFTEGDFNKLTYNGFKGTWSGYVWEIYPEGGGKVLGKFNPKKNTLFIAGKKDLSNPLVKYLQENSYVSSEEYMKLSKGGGINSGRDLLFKSKESHEQAYKRKREFKKYGSNGNWFSDLFDNGGEVEWVVELQNEETGDTENINVMAVSEEEAKETALIESGYKGYIANGANKKYAKGGGVYNENAEMILNNNKQIKHHTEELNKVVDYNTKVPAWVVAKVNRSASDLSDATHYLDGVNSEFKNGGGVGYGKIRKEKEEMTTELFNKLGVFFAFSNEQFNENKTPLKEGEKYVSIGAGGYIPKGNLDAFLEGMESINQMGKNKVKENNLAETEILYELRNHECFYTGDYSDVVDMFKGTYTEDEIRDIYNKHRESNQDFENGGGVSEDKIVKSKEAKNHIEVRDILDKWSEKYRIVNAPNFDLETPYSRGFIDEGKIILISLKRKKEEGKSTYYVWSWKEVFSNGGDVDLISERKSINKPKKLYGNVSVSSIVTGKRYKYLHEPNTYITLLKRDADSLTFTDDNGDWINISNSEVPNSVYDFKANHNIPMPELLSIIEVEIKIGRKLNSWKDDFITVGTAIYEKVYLRPEYIKKFDILNS